MDAVPTPESSFQAIPYPVRSFGGLKSARYHIYSAPGQFVTVEAETATDALRLAQITQPHRIIRDIPGREVLLDRKRVFDNLAAEAGVDAEAAKAAPEAQADAGQTPPAAN